MSTTKIFASMILAGLLMLGSGFLIGGGIGDQVTEPTAQAHGLPPLNEVVEQLTQRVAEHPSDYIGRTQLGNAMLSNARAEADLEGYHDAEAVFRDALVINATWQLANLGLARALHAQHDFPSALSTATAVLEDSPESVDAQLLRADALLELGQVDQAQSMYLDLAAEYWSAPVASRLARAASLAGDHVAAVSLADQALELSDDVILRPADQAFYHFQLGAMRFGAGLVGRAVEAYDAALDIDPGNPAAMEALAFALASTGEVDAALTVYEQLTAGGGAPDVHHMYAKLLRQQGDVDAASTHDRLAEEAAAEIGDRFPAERRHLVEYFIDVDPERAVALAAEDLELRQDLASYTTLAWAHHAEGNTDKALTVVQSSGVSNPPDAKTGYRWAQIYADAGDRAEAARLLNAALALNADFDPFEAADAARLDHELTNFDT